MRGSAASIFEISLRSRSRVRSSMARSVSSEARSVRSGFSRLSSLRCRSVSGRIGEQLGAPAQQLLPEVLELQRVHELFVIGRTVLGGNLYAYASFSPRRPFSTGAEYMNRVVRFQLLQPHFTMLIMQSFPGCLSNVRFNSRGRCCCRLDRRPPNTATGSFQRPLGRALTGHGWGKVFGHLALL